MSLPRGGRLAERFLHYSQAVAGPVASAGAQFLLSLQLLHALSPAAFGSFSFLMVASQFSAGLWSALFCAPLPALLAQGGEYARETIRRCMFTTNLAVAVVALLGFWAVAWALRLDAASAWFFSGYAALVLLRWFARADAYANGKPLRTMASDLAYSGCLLACICLQAWSPSLPAYFPYAALMGSALAGLMPFGRTYFAEQFLHISVQAMRPYGHIWKKHSGWSLLGVLTTEATGNSHAYLLTSLSGPTAFAPIAASALTIRPIGVAMNALMEFERPLLARHLGHRERAAVARSMRAFRWILLGAWAATALASVLLLALAPQLIFPAGYDMQMLWLATALWLAVAFMRQARAPDSALLQAAGAFRPLAQASLVSSILSVASVAALIVACGPVWSLAGLLLGETLLALWTWWQARTYLKENSR